MAAYHPDHPSVLIAGEFKQSPWIRPDDIERRGAILIWDYPPAGEKLIKQFPQAILQDPLKLAYETSANVRPAWVGWAILLPHEH